MEKSVNTLFPFQRHQFQSDFLFDGLPDDIVAILNRNQRTTRFKKGQIVFHEGTQPTGVFFVETGKVKKYAIGHDDREHIFYLCKEKEMLGYHALLSEEPYTDSAATLEDSEIAFIPKEDFLAAIDQSHTLCRRLLRNLGHEFSVFVNSTKMLAQYTVRERTALTLLILREKYKLREDEPETQVDLSREDLANMVGTATETLVRVLHDFKEEGHIEAHGRTITVKDCAGLLKVSNFY